MFENVVWSISPYTLNLQCIEIKTIMLIQLYAMDSLIYFNCLHYEHSDWEITSVYCLDAAQVQKFCF